MDIAKIRKKLKETKEMAREPSPPPPPEVEPQKETPEIEPVLPEESVELTEEAPAEPEETPQKPLEPIPEPYDDTEELLTFKLSNEDYAFKVSEIEEILRPQRYAWVPKTESFILGITSLRGKIIPLIDLKKRISLEGGYDGDKSKILILRGPKGSIGVVVDKVIDVIRVSSEEIVEPPSHLNEEKAKFIEGVVIVGNRFVSVMRLSEIMNFTIGATK